jgi:hypothetical protein
MDGGCAAMHTLCKPARAHALTIHADQHQINGAGRDALAVGDTGRNWQTATGTAACVLTAAAAAPQSRMPPACAAISSRRGPVGCLKRCSALISAMASSRAGRPTHRRKGFTSLFRGSRQTPRPVAVQRGSCRRWLRPRHPLTMAANVTAWRLVSCREVPVTRRGARTVRRRPARTAPRPVAQPHTCVPGTRRKLAQSCCRL